MGTHLCANDDCPAKERRIKAGRRTPEKAFLRGEGAGDNGVSDFHPGGIPVLTGGALVI